MKITADKNEILEATLPTSGFASNKSTIAATEGILFKTSGEDRCDICAYDLEKGLRSYIGCTVEEEGAVVINSARFIQVVRAMPNGPLTIEADEKTLRTVIYAGRARFELQAMSSKDFPDFPELRTDRGCAIKQKDLREMIQKTQFAIAVNNPRPELNGLNLAVKDDTVTAVACDGGRLSVCKQKCEIVNTGNVPVDFNIILPGKIVAELLRFISDSDDTIRLLVSRKHIMFFVDRYIIFTRLIDTEYVDYDRFIPKASNITAEVSQSELEGSLERALLITEERQQGQLKSPVICNITDGVLTVTSSSISGRVNDEIEVKHEGDNIEIGFNCRFLHEAVRVCESENVVIKLTSPLMGMTIEPLEKEENKELLLLVLPVRLNK